MRGTADGKGWRGAAVAPSAAEGQKGNAFCRRSLLLLRAQLGVLLLLLALLLTACVGVGGIVELLQKRSTKTAIGVYRRPTVAT